MLWLISAAHSPVWEPEAWCMLCVQITLLSFQSVYLARHVWVHGLTFIHRKFVLDYLNKIKPVAVRSRRHRKFVRKNFYAAGVNKIWCLDQHDKWGFLGLWLHVCIEPIAGYVIWAKAWHTNKNPRLIAGYYFDAAKEIGGESESQVLVKMMWFNLDIVQRYCQDF